MLALQAAYRTRAAVAPRLVALIVSLASAVGAQAGPSSTAAATTPVSTGVPICPPGGAPEVDSGTYAVVLSPGTAWNRHQYTDAERTRILYHADAIRAHFTPPPTLGDLPTIGESLIAAWGGAPSAHSAVGGKLVMVMRPNGRLRTVFWQVIPFSRPLAIALNNAVLAADTSHAFEGMPPATDPSRDDTLVVQVRSLVKEPEATDLPLIRARLARYVITSRLAIRKEGGLYYPSNAEYRQVENKGEMQVLVGSDGKAIMPATQVTRIEYRDFLSTMRRAIEGTVYEPARSGDCAIPAIMIHSFDFSIRR